eukprot:TRINITY_DN16913_c0_g1_i1.p1 TRINITY_DN16913_c0_g1~~TRINITY_DN16913_c0_g1_i1.p1  ORF type:complete len:439 (-),score=68.58 TRINITY_DN16913_c0_g1_i1:120-1436(-)
MFGYFIQKALGLKWLCWVLLVETTLGDRHESESTNSGGLNSKYDVLTFNLEGRGGNQKNNEGKERRVALENWLQEKLCNQKSSEEEIEVLLTQEDIQSTHYPNDLVDGFPGLVSKVPPELSNKPLSPRCYQKVIGCPSEEFWGKRAEYEFGDAGWEPYRTTYMMNNIWVHKKHLPELVSSWVVPLVSKELQETGLNPRCASVAHFVVRNRDIVVASFHLAGGYVDDNVFIEAIGRQSLTSRMHNIRSESISAIVDSVKERLGHNFTEATMILGGDTNGFPKTQTALTQSGRINGMIKPKWEELAPEGKLESSSFEKSKEDFVTTLTSPDEVEMLGLRMQRVPQNHLKTDDTDKVRWSEDQRHGDEDWDFKMGNIADQFESEAAVPAETVIAKSSGSTTPRGGSPDQFYTNHPLAEVETKILGTVGLEPGTQIPFKRRI